MSAPPPGDALAPQIGHHLALLGLGVVLIERGGRVVDADPVAERILGRRRADLLATPDVSALLAPEERFKRTTYRERRRRGELQGETFRSVAVLPDGTRRPIEASVLPLADGTHTGVVLRDLTDIASLDQVIDWYAALVQRMPVGVVLMDANGVSDPGQIRVWAVNQAASKAAGRDLAPFVGRTLAEVYPPGTRLDEARRALALRDTGAVEHFPDFVVGDRDRPTAVYRRTVVALPEGGLALVLDDITRERLDDIRHRQVTERLVTLGDTERRAIAMGIHDDPIQQIAAAALLVAQLRRRSEGDERAHWLDDVDDALRRATTSLRDLVFELAPSELVESGLASAIAKAVDHLFGAGGTHVEVDVDIDAEPDHAIQTTVFRIVAEALTNARKHAAARWITVCVRTDDRCIVASVTDDGAGFDVGEGNVAKHGHLGLRSMYDRAAAIGGSLDVASSPAGTRVTARLPLEGTGSRNGSVDAADAQSPQITGPILADLPDSEVESLRLELATVRESAARSAEAAALMRSRWTTLATLRDALVTLPDDLDARAAVAAELVARAAGDACSVRIADGDVLRTIACWHPDPEQRAYLAEWVLSDRSAVTSHPAVIYRTGQPLLLERSRFDWWLPSDGPEPPPAPVHPHHAIGVPLRRGAAVFGVMTVVRDRSPEPLLPDDIPWVWALGDVVAACLPT